MGLFDMFRRPPPIADVEALEDFLDSHAAFLVQKCVFEYARARAGVFWDKLFREPDFIAAVDVARWNGFVIALADVVEMVEAALRPAARGREAALLDRLIAIAEAVIHRYPVPANEPFDFWVTQVDWLRDRLAEIQLAPPKAVKDIPLSTARRMFELMPIHQSLRGGDFVVVRNHLRSNLCRMSEEFGQRVEIEPLLADTLAPPQPVRMPAIGAG
jgi:hypothetical protein